MVPEEFEQENLRLKRASFSICCRVPKVTERTLCSGVNAMSAKQARQYDTEVNRMRRLILTTASVLALGLGGAGFAHAAAYSSKSTGATNLPPAQTQMHTMSSKTTRTSTTKVSKSEVKQAQEKLRQKGLYRGRTDGIIGRETKTALRTFQRKNGLPVTGSLDRRTMSALEGAKMTSGQGSSMPSGKTGAVPLTLKPAQSGQTGNAGAEVSATGGIGAAAPKLQK
jgi:hypothetical protein